MTSNSFGSCWSTMLRPFAHSLRTTLLLHCCVEVSQFYIFLVEIKDFVSVCLLCCFKGICSLMWREYKFLSFFIMTFLQIYMDLESLLKHERKSSILK